ncbi:MAG: methyltransferase domain-containing protein [Candidatus Omnitrophica bacterium]|nr:methyltransferase domain-containing protein [Candidatus Omnitrophota bacterium]
MCLGKLILEKFSHSASGDPAPEDSNAALANLVEVFPQFLSLVQEKTILDFGCGKGYQSLALAKTNAKHVQGFDINEGHIKIASATAVKENLSNRVSFNTILSSQEQYDIVISHNSFEHFDDPEEIFNKMLGLVKPGGYIFITFGPPWYSPYGAHMNFFTSIPWVHLLFSERTVMTVRARYRNDNATKYTQVTSGLNKLSVRKFFKIIKRSGVNIVYQRLDALKKINFLSKIPLLRELFITRVSVILKK